MLAGALVKLFFAWNGSQTFEDLEAKQSVMIHCVKATHPITGACALTIVPSFFSVMAGFIVGMLFMLFSIYNTA